MRHWTTKYQMRFFIAVLQLSIILCYDTLKILKSGLDRGPIIIDGVAQDLLDTLQANSHRCIGMAANMIGITKAIIAVDTQAEARAMAANAVQCAGMAGLAATAGNGEGLLLMLNPRYTKKSPRTYSVKEGCLSLSGERVAERHQWVEVIYRDMQWQKRKQRFAGLTAEIIQHEMDHLAGILI